MVGREKSPVDHKLVNFLSKDAFIPENCNGRKY